MKAIRIHEFGGPEVLKLEDIDKPAFEADEILVKVYASGINPVDWVVRNGGNDFLRPHLQLPMTIGWDAAGVVKAVGSEVTSFKIGDEVFGSPNFPGTNGSYAEYSPMKANQCALKPKSISFIEASAVPLVGLVAWTGLFALGKLQAGQKLLLLGASGGVGSFAVQFAKAKGVYVIASASTNNIEFLKDLGADEVIDYKTQQFEDLVKEVDVVFDASPLRDEAQRLKTVNVLKNNGILVSVNVDFPFSESIVEALKQKNATGELIYTQMNRPEWLTEMAELFDAGKVKVFVSKVFQMEEVAEAHKESESWHTRGKLVLEIQKEN